MLVLLVGFLRMFRTVRKVTRTNFTALRGRRAAQEMVMAQSEEQVITWQSWNLCEERIQLLVTSKGYATLLDCTASASRKKLYLILPSNRSKGNGLGEMPPTPPPPKKKSTYFQKKHKGSEWVRKFLTILKHL